MDGELSTLPKTGEELRDWLVRLFPDFALMFVDNYQYPPDETLTSHRACSAFTDYYLTRIPSFSAPEVVELFRVTEFVLATQFWNGDTIANALCTCFLENISCTDQGHAGRPLMGAETLRFFDGWHYPYLDQRGLPRSF